MKKFFLMFTVNYFFNFFEIILEKMSDFNDYEAEEIIINDERVVDSNSNKKKAIFHGF
jgi:hypothetical protein